MKKNKELFTVSKLTLAVLGALMVMLSMPLVAYAEDGDVAALTQPTNSVEVGVGGTSKDSAKFGEYNGLDKKGAHLIGNFTVRGGDAYESHGGGDGVNRWELNGTDLGTTSRELGGTYSKQGQWDVGFKYDELRHNITDTYQMPMMGSMGGNSFILPNAFGVIDSRTKPALVGGVVPPYGAQALTPNQLAYFHTENVYTDRKNAKFNAGYRFDQQWSLQFDFNRLTQDGAKLIAAPSDANLTNGITGVRGENILMLMNPTNYQTDTMNLSANWAGDKAHFTASYYLSQFRDGYNGVSFSNPFATLGAVAPNNATGTDPGVAFPVDTLSTAPDNNFQQLNLAGGYDLTSATKLAGGISYGRNTQDMAYVNADQMVSLPQQSLNALVVTQHADLKLTNQTTRDLMLSAGFKYNKRDNQTASNTYTFNDLGGGAITSINTPLSNKKTQFELAGDYRITQSQKLRVGYDYEQIDRWCDNSPSLAAILAASQGIGGTTPAPAPANAAAAYYALGTSCVQVPQSKENKLAANYRLNATENVGITTSYEYSKRKSDVNAAFYNPMQGQNQGFELPGYVAFFDASRTEQLVKAGVNWQTTEKLNVSLNGRYVDDKYTDSALGVQSGHAWSANLDTTYSLAEKSSVSAYATAQNRQRDLLNDQWNHQTATYGTAITNGSLTQPWTNRLSEDAYTLGLGAKQGGLMGSKLDLTADLTYSLGKSGYTTTDNWVNAACTTPSNAGYACGSTPDIRSVLFQFKIAGDYKLDKASKIRVGYLYQNLKSTDYYYNAYQTGYTATSMMPTNQQAPSYSVNVITASYLHIF